MAEASYTFPVIGTVHSCYKAKFGVPRQPGLIREATGYIQLEPPYNQPNTVRGLERFSHIWVLFVFHHNLREEWKATVRPPRLGGDTRIGVFASRSPFRPAPVGLSVLRLEEVQLRDHGVIRLQVSGLDIVDGTPVIDIKPYVPYTDAIPEAEGAFASAAPEAAALPVTVSPEAARQFAERARRGQANLQELAVKVIAADPRPAYQREPGRVYGVFLDNVEVVWQMDDTASAAVITEIKPAAGPSRN